MATKTKKAVAKKTTAVKKVVKAPDKKKPKALAAKSTAKKTVQKKKTPPVAKAKTPAKAVAKKPTKPAAKVKSKPIVKTAAKAVSKTPAKKPVRAATVKSVSKKPAEAAKVATPLKAVAKKTISTSTPKMKTNEAMLKSEKPKKATASTVSHINPDKTRLTESIDFLGVSPYQEQAGEEYMNDKQRQHFREILVRWRKALMEEVDRTVHHMKDAVNFADPNDRATQEEEFSFELRARDRERKLIRKIDEAVQRIDDKEYGYCDACGIDIGIRRLEARPTATLCIDCKTLDEIKEKQTRL